MGGRAGPLAPPGCTTRWGASCRKAAPVTGRMVAHATDTLTLATDASSLRTLRLTRLTRLTLAVCVRLRVDHATPGERGTNSREGGLGHGCSGVAYLRDRDRYVIMPDTTLRTLQAALLGTLLAAGMAGTYVDDARVLPFAEVRVCRGRKP